MDTSDFADGAAVIRTLFALIFGFCFSVLVAEELTAAALAVGVEARTAYRLTNERIASQRASEMTAVVAAAEQVRGARIALRAAREARDQAVQALAMERQHQEILTTSTNALRGRIHQVLAVPGGMTAADAAEVLKKIPSILAQEMAIHIISEPVHDRQGNLQTVPVLHLGTARAMALGEEPATRGAIVIMGGAPLISGPPLAKEFAVGSHLIPLDVTGSWAATPPARGLREWLAAGRFFIWPILAVGLVGVLVFMVRATALLRLRFERARIDRAITDPTTCAAGSDALARVLQAGLANREGSLEQQEAALDQAILSEGPLLSRGLSMLVLGASVAPLLGLLWTVTGMIDLFAVLGQSGSGSARGLTGGISEALVATQAGMLVAVPLLIGHAVLHRLVERRLLVLEEAASAVLAVARKPQLAHPLSIISAIDPSTRQLQTEAQ